jgi:threonine-phosphate decarboxylase
VVFVKKSYKSSSVNFSCAINPAGVPQKAKAAVRKAVKKSDCYPDISCSLLRNALARYHKINADSIICGCGATELIYLIIRTLKPEKIMTLAPVNPFVSHAAWSYRASVTSLVLNEKDDFSIPLDIMLSSLAQCDLFFLTNPYEPVGRIIIPEAIKSLIAEAILKKTFLIVDESLIDFCDNSKTLISDAQELTHAIVLRSFSKFYALAGLRVGYGVAHKELINKFSLLKEPYTVNSVAQAAARATIGDRRYRDETKKETSNEKNFLIKELRAMGFTVFDCHGNFFLVKGLTDELKLRLKEKGYLLPQALKDYENITKIFVQSHTHNTRFIKTLRNLFVTGD